MSRNSNRSNDTKPATKAAADRTDAAGTVSVACRLPAGLSVDVRGHGTLVFKGANDRRALALADEQGFHGITTGVPKDAWEALTEQYASAKWLTNGFVFAASKVKDVVREAQDIGATDAGFNAVDPETQGVTEMTDVPTN